MADYIYLLENRLSASQRSALLMVREIAKSKSLTVFLVGGAVRDLTSGSPVRDLDVAVQGNALKLRKDIERAGGVIAGEYDPGQALYVRFPGGVRMEVGSTLAVSYPKPGKPVAKPATILEDLRRRDFTANAMAISLNEGSYGLLMDPLNGVADIENRELRLVSNYGFIEDPVRMVRAARLMARLGWMMDEKTQQRYETGVQEGYISALSEFLRGYESEEIVHEEDPLRVLKRLETDGWMKVLAPYWTSAKVNVAELERLREVQTQLQMQGIQPDPAAANFPLLTAKLTAKEAEGLKKGFPRPGFVAEIDALEGEAKEVAAQLGGKSASTPSLAWKLITSARPEAVLWMAYSSKNGAVQAKLKSFYTEWPQARTKIPYSTMQEMRITPELPVYDELLEKLFFALMDGQLQTPEEMKAFLEPYSPPAPPPPVSMRRPRAAKKEAKASKGRGKKAAKPEDEAENETPELDGEALSEVHKALPDDDEDEPETATEADDSDEDGEEAEDEDSAPTPVRAVPSAKAAPPAKSAAASGSPESQTGTVEIDTAGKTSAAKTAVKADAQSSVLFKGIAAKGIAAKGSLAKATPATATPLKASSSMAIASKAVSPKGTKTAAKLAAKAPVKPLAKPVAKGQVKAAPKTVSVKKVPAKKTVTKSAPAKKMAAVKAVPAKPATKAAPAKAAKTAPKKSLPAKASAKTAKKAAAKKR